MDSDYFVAPDANGAIYIWLDGDNPFGADPIVGFYDISDDYLWAKITDGLERRP